MSGIFTCSSCGHVPGSSLAGWTLGLSAGFVVSLLVTACASEAWQRVFAVGTALGCVGGLLLLRAVLAKAEQLRAVRPDLGAQAPLTLKRWTVVTMASVAVLWLAMIGFSAIRRDDTTSVVSSTTAPKYALKGEAFRVGDRITDSTEFHIPNARLQIRGADKPTEILAECKTVHVEQWALGQVASRQPVRMIGFLKQAESHNKITIDGKSSDETVNSQFAGILAVEFTRMPSSSVWAKQLSAESRSRLSHDAMLIAEAEREVTEAQAWDARDNLYPDEPIAVGAEWVRTGANLRLLLDCLGYEVLSVEGEARCRLAEVMQFQGQTCACVTFNLNARGTCLDPKLGKMEFTLSCSGQTLRSISQGIDLSTSISGTLEQRGEVVESSGTQHLSLGGSFTATGATTLERTLTDTQSPPAVSTSGMPHLPDLKLPSGSTPTTKPLDVRPTPPEKVSSLPKKTSIPLKPTPRGKAGLLKLLLSGR